MSETASTLLPMFLGERLPSVASRLRRLAELVGSEHMAEASMALGDANYLDDLPEAIAAWNRRSISHTGWREGIEAAVAIVQMARNDEMDGDFRSIISAIRSLSPPSCEGEEK